MLAMAVSLPSLVNSTVDPTGVSPVALVTAHLPISLAESSAFAGEVKANTSTPRIAANSGFICNSLLDARAEPKTARRERGEYGIPNGGVVREEFALTRPVRVRA